MQKTYCKNENQISRYEFLKEKDVLNFENQKW